MVKLHTNHGVISLELDAEARPETVANFLQYVKDGHFDNTVFHRVIDGFMIQGGGFAPGMKQKPTRAAGKERSRQQAREQRLHGRHGAHVRPALGERPVLHQRRRQRVPEPHRARRRRAGATACSGASPRARTSWTGSRRSRPARAACTRTCRWRTSSSRRRRSSEGWIGSGGVRSTSECRRATAFASRPSRLTPSTNAQHFRLGPAPLPRAPAHHRGRFSAFWRKPPSAPTRSTSWATCSSTGSATTTWTSRSTRRLRRRSPRSPGGASRSA